MTDLIEVAITSDASGSQWSCCAWDPRAGTNLMTYKGGGAPGANALSFIRNEFIVTGNIAKPLIHIWPVNSQEQIQGARLVTPGRVTALAISPDGIYCVAGVAEIIYVWQISSGRMLAALSRHYQSVTSIKFTDDGSHFVSAGQDGMVLLWKLSQVIVPINNQPTAPLYSFSDHALPVSAVHIGKGGMRAYLVTVSLDRTCKVYDLASGSLLLNLVFQEALTSVTVDHLDTKVYVGSAEGHIYEFSLQSPPRMKEYHVSKEDVNNRFSGHKGAVTTVSISLDGDSLLSGGVDENVLLWHIPSKQLIRTLPHKGIVTNAVFTLAPRSMFDIEIKLNLIISNFKRMMDNDTADNHVVEVLVTDKIYEEQAALSFTGVGHTNGSTAVLSATPAAAARNGGSSALESNQELDRLRAEVKNLRRKNKELFEFSIKNVLKKKSINK